MTITQNIIEVYIHTEIFYIYMCNYLCTHKFLGSVSILAYFRLAYYFIKMFTSEPVHFELLYVILDFSLQETKTLLA